MSDPESPKGKLFGLTLGPLQGLVDRMRGKGEATPEARDLLAPAARDIPEAHYRIEARADFVELARARSLAGTLGIPNPFFRCHEGLARDTSRIDGTDCVNFSTYNYLDLSGHPEVSRAAIEAVERYGTSASASRIVSGEKPVHRELEDGLKAMLRTEGCLTFVSGFVTNVTVIGVLLGRKDLILHDALIHSSVIQGAILSGAKRLAFPHNDMEALDRTLAEVRSQFERVLVVAEGLYSMDGDLAPLPRLVELRRKHRVMLMIDEAHSIGVLGATGRGLGEHFGVDPGAVDVWMGTLSKTLAGCGGYVGGSAALIELLRYTAPGFVYSVGMPPPMAAASLAALRIMLREPERVATLAARTRTFLEAARAAGLDTGKAEGFAIVPVIVGSSMRAAKASARLLEQGFNVMPIVAPAVEERAARLRFFMSSAHRDEQLVAAAAATRSALAG